jgi:hypothetical protein
MYLKLRSLRFRMKVNVGERNQYGRTARAASPVPWSRTLILGIVPSCHIFDRCGAELVSLSHACAR